MVSKEVWSKTLFLRFYGDPQARGEYGRGLAVKDKRRGRVVLG